MGLPEVMGEAFLDVVLLPESCAGAGFLGLAYPGAEGLPLPLIIIIAADPLID